jgi:hypothetical protein
MKLKRWGFAALCVLGMHCSQSPSPPPAGNTGGTSSGSSSMSGSGGTGSGTVGPGSGATVGGSGVTSVGSGSGDTSASGSGGGGDAGTCALGVQGISYSGCNACGLCWQQRCCQQSNACLNDTTCNGYLACQSTCYNGQAPDGAAIDVDAASLYPDGGTLADDCANNCLPPDAGPLWNVMQDCISPTCDTPCLCP